jgi:hypothetical protein
MVSTWLCSIQQQHTVKQCQQYGCSRVDDLHTATIHTCNAAVNYYNTQQIIILRNLTGSQKRCGWNEWLAWLCATMHLQQRTAVILQTQQIVYMITVQQQARDVQLE